MPKHKACTECGACDDKERALASIEAVNEIGAKVGDRVLIELPDKEIIKASLMVYLLPVAMMLIGYLLGNWLISESGGVVSSFAFLALSFFVVRWYDHYYDDKQARRARIISILE